MGGEVRTKINMKKFEELIGEGCIKTKHCEIQKFAFQIIIKIIISPKRTHPLFKPYILLCTYIYIYIIAEKRKHKN